MSFATDFAKFSRLELLDLSGNQFTGSLHVEGTFTFIVFTTIYGKTVYRKISSFEKFRLCLGISNLRYKSYSQQWLYVNEFKISN